jgi:hypothetical protein
LKSQSFSSASLGAAGVCLVVALAAACSFDASRLRSAVSPAVDGPDAQTIASDAVASDGEGDTAIVRDAPAGMPDAYAGTGGGDTPAATGGVGGSGGPTEIGGTKEGDGPIVMGGADGSDVLIATGGAGGSAGAGDAADSIDGTDAATGSGGAGGDIIPTGGRDAKDDSNAGGSPGSGGETDTGGVGGGTGTDTAGGAGSGGNGSGGQGAGVDAAADAADTGETGSGGVGGAAGSGGTGGGGVDAATGAAGTGGNACNGQCPLIATIGITGVWDYTYSNGTSGDVVTTGNNLFLAWLATRSANCTVENLDISGSNYLTAARLARYKVIVVLDIYHTQADKDAFLATKKTNPGAPAYLGKQRAILASEANAVQDWVGAGGGLMTIAGISSRAAEMANVNALLNGFLIAYSVTDVYVLPGNSTVTTFATAPPIANQITTGVGTLPVSGAVGIEGLNGGNLPPNSSSFSQYATGGESYGRGGFGNSYAIGVAKLVSGAGHLNVWGDEWITYDSAWTGAYNVSVQAYWNNVLTWLGQCP